MRIHDDLARCRNELKDIYRPATALTDPRIQELNREIARLEGIISNQVECDWCEGEGEWMDDDGDIQTCGECFGVGLIRNDI